MSEQAPQQFIPNSEQQQLRQQLIGEQREVAAPVTMVEALKELERAPGMHADVLYNPDAATTFRPASMTSVDSPSFPEDGIYQSPVAVVRAGRPHAEEGGGDDYLISSVYDTKSNQGYHVLSHFGQTVEDQPLTVGIIGEEGVVIGRGIPESHARGDWTSRKHATISKDKEGNIKIVNHGGNGTQVVYPKAGQIHPSEHSVAMGGFRSPDITPEQTAANPIVYRNATKLSVKDLRYHTQKD